MTAKVVLTQPYLPVYRIPLFEEVRRILAGSDVDFRVIHGTPTGSQSKRGDKASASWASVIDEKRLTFAGRSVSLRDVGDEARNADLVVTELAASNLFAWKEVLRGRRPVILWGHGMPYVSDAGKLGDSLEWALARRATHSMTYSESGREYMIQHGGIPGSRVTAIGNATDVKSLRDAFRASTSPEFDEIAPHRAIFIGGLDAEKRIDFLLDAAKLAHDIDPSFRLIVVGKGEMDAEVKEAAAQGYVEAVGSARGADLAALMAQSSAVWMPGRIGLVACDALAVGMPLVTTQGARHAPEADFLTPREVVHSQNDSKAFAVAALRVSEMSPAPSMRPLRDEIPSIESVAKAFSAVVKSALDRT